MRALTAGELLDVWEAGSAQALPRRALALLGAACPEISADALASLSIGQRDAGLLTLRERLWGPRMTAVTACPRCREALEFGLDTREMLSNSPRSQPDEIPVNLSEFSLTLRLPTSRDLLDTAGESDLETCRDLIFRRCLVSAHQGDTEVDCDDLPADVVAAAIRSMAEADPLADIRLQAACPSCKHRWQAVFDIVTFLWTELEIWAWRILSDVHTLASAYGWRECDVLALSPTRRQFYLDMAGA
jgi:hypothetical protein